MRQTLALLLAGDSEKQIAHRLGLSQHTVHVYVKALYRRYDVSSRGELLARWVPKAERALTTSQE
jgi:two-component system nitrate/nitrite response regulator NarL